MEWKKYQDPSDQPDATSERDMNTFITLTMETKSEALAEMLDTVKKIETVASAVEVVWSDSFAKKDAVAQRKAFTCLGEFNSLILEKIDAATAHYLHFVDAQLDAKSEVSLEETALNVCIGLWGSFADMRPQRKSIQFEKMGMSMDIPKQILQQETRFVHRVVRVPIDTHSLGAYAASSSASSSQSFSSKLLVLSDLMYFDILIPPPLPFRLRAKKWLIRDNSDNAQSLRKSSYPSSVPSKCFIKVPANLIMSDDVTVKLWNPDTRDWTDEGISDFQYSEATRLVQFLMSTVGVVAFVRSRSVDFPYKSWSLEPLRASSGSTDRASSEQQARFSVHTQRFEVVIDIRGTSCCLAKAFNKAVAHLVDVPMTPGLLLSKLQKCGVNLLPVEADFASIEGSCPKVRNLHKHLPLRFFPNSFLIAPSASLSLLHRYQNAALELDVMRELAKCASCLDFQSSDAWNRDLSEAQMGLLLRESTAYTAFGEAFDYECVLVEQDNVSESYRNAPDEGLITGLGASAAKYTLVFGNEYGLRRGGFDLKPRPGELSHIELAAAASTRCTAEARERIKRCNVLFQETVFTLLSLVRPLTFS